jgi:hypothetical protein
MKMEKEDELLHNILWAINLYNDNYGEEYYSVYPEEQSIDLKSIKDDLKQLIRLEIENYMKELEDGK